MTNRNIKRRIIRKIRVKKRIGIGTGKMRISVFRSSKYLYGQLIDDLKRHTITCVGMKDLKGMKKEESAPKAKAAFALGKIMASRVIKAKVDKIVFDRNGYRYHGRVKAFAEGLREGGIKF